MDATMLPRDIFGLRFDVLGESSASTSVPRVHLGKFDICDARLGDAVDFIVAIAKGRPTVGSAKALLRALGRVDQRPVAVCFNMVDSKMGRAFATEGVPFLAADGNAYLPFAGIASSPARPLRAPSTLSAQAQRIFFNMLAGRWNGVSAGDLARLCGKSNGSVTRYLSEIAAVEPSLVRAAGKSRILENQGMSKSALLGAFQPYLASPVKKAHRLKNVPSIEVLGASGALCAGETALSFYSDLALDPLRLTVAVGPEGLEVLKGSDAWEEAAWYEDAACVVEEWAYPVDAPLSLSVAATGIASVDCCSLYAALSLVRQDDVRIVDAIDQLREEICR